MVTAQQILVAHTTNPDDGEPLDVLIRVWTDGSVEVAVRPGHDQTDLIWGPPVVAEDRTWR